jgi:hypothetical protein
MKPHDFRYLDELIGLWEIRYPELEAAGDYVELLELKPDGTFSWSPNPIWAKPGGRWGVTHKVGTQEIKLHFQRRKDDHYRGECLVFTTLNLGDSTVRAIHWQRTQYGAVVFADRIWVGRKLADIPNSVPDASGVVYPYLIVRLMPAVYMRAPITIEVGPPAVEIVGRGCRVSHPAPLASDGSVAADCRALIVDGVRAAVRNGRHRMTIFWGGRWCTYCEVGYAMDSTFVPSGGIQLISTDLEPHRYEPGAPDSLDGRALDKVVSIEEADAGSGAQSAAEKQDSVPADNRTPEDLDRLSKREQMKWIEGRIRKLDSPAPPIYTFRPPGGIRTSVAWFAGIGISIAAFIATFTRHAPGQLHQHINLLLPIAIVILAIWVSNRRGA